MIRIVAFLGCLVSCGGAFAQNLVITNARIIDGTGAVIERGSVVVEGGRITSVSAGESDATGVSIDARGMTVMPGLIDTHWHVFGDALPTGDDDVLDQYVETGVNSLLESLLARGITTIMSTGDYFPHVLELRRQLASGEKRGPRLISVGRQITGPGDWASPLCEGNSDCESKYTAQPASPVQARNIVRQLAESGVDGVKVVYDDVIVPDVRISDDVVAAITDEAAKYDLTVYAHVSTREPAGLRVVDLGVRRLVHPPIAPDSNLARVLYDRQIPVATTVSGATREWCQLTGEAYDDALFQQWLGEIEDLRDAGVLLAFGTDSASATNARERFLIEARTLSQVLTNAEVIAALTRNAALFMGWGDEIGTLEPGKIADLVVMDGDPLSDISDLDNVRAVIQSGQIVVDNL